MIMATDTKDEVKFNRPRTFLVKDFAGFRSALTQYARAFFAPEKLNDFSETGLAGMKIELLSYIGDNLSFYLDHQFAELDVDVAVESQNIERHLRAAGVPIRGASPAVTYATFAVEVAAERVGAVYMPSPNELPVVLAGTIVESNSGIRFELQEDVDFTARTTGNELRASVSVSEIASDGTPTKFILTLDGLMVSGFRTIETFSFGSEFRPFRTITLGNENVTEIVSVTDTDGNTYHEVESLAQDTVFQRVANVAYDANDVADNLELKAAPYRFTTATSLDSRATTLRFGGGRALSYDIDNIPDPSELALPLFGKKTFPRFTLDPNSLLTTNTLGISPINTSISVDYRYGGGLTHNIEPNTLRNIVSLLLRFPGNPIPAAASRVRGTVAATNRKRATGGDSALSIQELRQRIPAFRNAQSRVVTAPDVLARVYTLPSNFGRVFRAGIRSNPNNPLATQLFVVARDNTGRLTHVSDTLKLNLRTYLNPFRMISEAIDILDAPVVNIGVEYQVVTVPSANKQLVIQGINQRLVKFLDIRERQIDQPISLSDLRNLIFNNAGVVAVVGIKVRNFSGIMQGKNYSNVQHDVTGHTIKEHIFPPPGGIFEVAFPTLDIIGSVV
jgi:hypothetical protein